MRRLRTRSSIVPMLLAATLAIVAFTHAATLVRAATKEKLSGTQFWVAPDLAAYPVKSIAMLPAAAFDGSIENRRLVESSVGQALRGSGHRWLSPTSVRDLLMRMGSDSLGTALNEKLLKQREPRLDSLDAPFVSRTLRARAILSVRIDQMERRELEPGQSGRPTTSVLLRAALVDSTGRLLWTASSSQTLEGAQQEARGGNVIGVKASGLNNSAVGGTSAAPLFQEVLLQICTRWAEQFPKKAVSDTAGAAK